MKSLSYLNKYFIKYKWRVLFGVLSIVGSNYLFVNMPLIVKDAVNQFETNFNVSQWASYAFKLAGIYLLLSVGKGIFLFITRQTLIMVSRYIEFDLKNEVYDHYQKLGFNFYKRNSTGDLMNRISEDVSKVRMYLGPGIMYSLNLVVMAAFTITFMLNISVELTLYTLAPLPILSVIIYVVSSIVNRQSERVQRQESKISTLVQETFAGIPVIKAYSAEERFQEDFTSDAEEYLDKQMALVKTNAFFHPTVTFLIGMSIVLTIYFGGLLTMDTQSSLTSGDIVAFIFYVNMLSWPFISIGWVTSIVQRAAASQERINEFLNEEPEIVNPTNEAFNFEGEIAFENVSYTFPTTGIKAVNDLSFTVKKGETLAILGRTGSGKSTVINLLMRQFDPDKGKVKIDGKDLKKINLDDFRKQSGIVPQEVFLFSDTIRNNVHFGLSDTNDKSDQRVIDALKTTHVWNNVKAFKNGLDTELGERGVNLSGGQKQRISIARALIRQPKLLILDDCLSAVDTETEDIILRNLDKTLKERTGLIVSHRISSIRNADRIIVLENGRKIEEGTHAELIALGGEYAQMYEHQLIEEEKDSE